MWQTSLKRRVALLAALALCLLSGGLIALCPLAGGPAARAADHGGPGNVPVFVRTFGSSGHEPLGTPAGIAVGPDGRVWVSDGASGQIEEYTSKGALVIAFGGRGTGPLSSPAGIAITRGGDVWVADSGHDRIVEFTPQGKELAAVGSTGAGASQFRQPSALAIAPDGDIYVADAGNGRVERLSAGGRYLTSIAIAAPAGIAIDNSGNLWVSSFSSATGNLITEFALSGRQLQSFGITQAEFGALTNPAGLAIGPDGRIYVAQPDYGLVTVLSRSGDFYTQFGLPGDPAGGGGGLAFPQDVAIAPDGAVYVTQGGSAAIAQYALAGSAAAAGRPGGTADSAPVAAPGPTSLRRVGGVPLAAATKPQSAWLPVLGALLGAIVAGGGCWLVLSLLRRRRAASEPAETPDLTRRAVITGAALLTGAAVGAGVLPLALRRQIAAVAASPPPARLKDVEHIVILMQENRSFDHYYGAMHGVRGFADPDALKLADGRPVFYQPDHSHPQGYLLPFRYDTRTTSAQATPGTDHSWPTQHQAWNGGRMDQWIPAKGEFTMGYFTGDDIPFHWALAQAFTLCDGYHCSVFGPTNPNRLYMWTGMIDPGGTRGGPVIDNTPAFDNVILSWTTYPERLQAAGISWQVYQEEDNYDDNALAWFKQYANAPVSSPLHQRGIRKQPAGSFEDDARHDRLPQVSWLVAPAAQSEHPDYLPAAGAEYIAQKLDAIAANPDVWAKTAFILCYDENDGLFDHVPPPVPPSGTPAEFVQGEPIGLGFRVPTTIVSPWTAGGYVCSDMFDHTSLIRFIEARFGVHEPNISAWRRQTCGDLTSAFRFAGPGAAYPRGNTQLRLDSAESGLLAAQQEVSANPGPAIPSANQPLPR